MGWAPPLWETASDSMRLDRESPTLVTVRALQLTLNGRALCLHGTIRAAGGRGFIVYRDGLLIFYCAAVGFVASGVAASFYKMMTHEAARFTLLGEGWFAAFVTFLFCALTGPAIVMDLVFRQRTTGENAVALVVAGLVVAVLWSVCSGILVLSLVLSLRDSLA